VVPTVTALGEAGYPGDAADGSRALLEAALPRGYDRRGLVAGVTAPSW